VSIAKNTQKHFVVRKKQCGSPECKGKTVMQLTFKQSMPKYLISV